MALTSTAFDKLIIKSIEELYAYSLMTGELKFAFDQMKSAELSGDNETVYAEGKQGLTLAALKRKKTAKFTCENGFVIASAFAAQLGSEVEDASSTKKVRVQRQEYITLAEGGTELTLTDTPATGTLKYIYKLNADLTKNKAYALTTDYTVDTKKATFTTAPGAATYLAIYDTDVEIAKRIVNSGDKFADTVKLVINMLGEDPCTHEEYLIQTTIPSADIAGTYSLSVGDNPAVQSFEANAMLNACSVDKELFTTVIA